MWRNCNCRNVKFKRWPEGIFKTKSHGVKTSSIFNEALNFIRQFIMIENFLSIYILFRNLTS